MRKGLLMVFGGLIFALTPMQLSAQDKLSEMSAGGILYEIIETEGTEAAVQKFKELQQQGDSQFDISEPVLNKLGYRLLQENKSAAALEIFKLNAETYPKSVNVWDSLAEANFTVGEKGRAEELYRKVLKMLEADTTLAPPVQNFYRNNTEIQLYKVQHFDPPAIADFHYAGFYGGFPAGKWDMQNLVKFKQQRGLNVSYSGSNLYRSPVPNSIEAPFKGRYPADVIHSFMGGDYQRFIREGKITDISYLWEKGGWDAVFPDSFKRMVSVDKKQYFLPMAFQWNPVWYRRDIFKKEGLHPPESWEELLELCRKLNDLGYTPFTVAVQQWPPPLVRWFTILNLRLNGADFHKHLMQGKISYKDVRVRNVFLHWNELFQHRAFDDNSWKNNYATALQDLNSGEAVMYNLGEWLFESLDEEQKAKLDFFSFPEMNPEVRSAEIVHAYGAFIRTGSENRQQSEALLKWLAGKESQQSNAEYNRRTVAHTGVDPSAYTDIQKRIIKHVSDTEILVPLFEVYTHPDFARAAFPILQKFWKDKDIDRVLTELEIARQQVFGGAEEG